MTAGSRFSAASAVAGSPGSARTPRNTTMLESSRTTRAAPSFRSRKPPITVLSLLLRPRRLEPGELRADQTVAEHLEAADLPREPEAVDRVVQVDQRQILHHLHERRVVGRDALVQL